MVQHRDFPVLFHFRDATYTGNQPLEVKVCPSGYPGIVFHLAADNTAVIESIELRNAQTSQIPILFLGNQ
jgi:hypothetical protein